ncbi:MAG: hypothetical protein OIF50_14155 [Flavobacteriaceae bacterium]|nr:hypothetical protein [Flavobacteriaceae bacterium]
MSDPNPNILPLSITSFMKSYIEQYHSPLESLGLEMENFRRMPFTKVQEHDYYDSLDLEEVLYKNDTKFFGIFDYMEIAYGEHDTEYIFRKRNPDMEELKVFVQEVFDYLGPPRDRSDIFISFIDFDKVFHQLASHPQKDAPQIRDFWFLKDGDRTIVLNMSWEEDPVFEMEIPSYGPEVDYSPRTNGTILDVLHFDIPEVLADAENLHPYYSEQDDSTVIFGIYLTQRLFGFFNKLDIRQEGEGIDPAMQTSTKVRFFTRREYDISKILEFINMLVKIYGSDDNGKKWGNEEDVDEYNHGFMGAYRTWTLNQHHGLYNSNMPGDEKVYVVSFMAFEPEEEFYLEIDDYQNVFRFQ